MRRDGHGVVINNREFKDLVVIAEKIIVMRCPGFVFGAFGYGVSGQQFIVEKKEVKHD